MKQNLTILEPIITYNLNEMEAKAFKLSLLWFAICKKEIPNYLITPFKTNQDPRKSIIFKYCYKLAIETKGLIPDNEYKLYITAQIQTLKNYTEGNVHSLISPACLVGVQAWRRWKHWKQNYNSVEKKLTGMSEDIKFSIEKIKEHLIKTKLFLEKFYGKLPSKNDIKLSIKNKNMLKWIKSGNISPFYLILSGYNEIEGCDLQIYNIAINDEIKKWFFAEFEEK